MCGLRELVELLNLLNVVHGCVVILTEADIFISVVTFCVGSSASRGNSCTRMVHGFDSSAATKSSGRKLQEKYSATTLYVHEKLTRLSVDIVRGAHTLDETVNTERVHRRFSHIFLETLEQILYILN